MNINNIINPITSAMQNPFVAATTTAAANIVFIEISLRIVQFVLDFLKDCDLHCSRRTKGFIIGGMVITILTTSIAAMNIALHKLLKFDSRLVIGTAILTNVCYISYQIYNDDD